MYYSIIARLYLYYIIYLGVILLIPKLLNFIYTESYMCR